MSFPGLNLSIVRTLTFRHLIILLIFLGIGCDLSVEPPASPTPKQIVGPETEPIGTVNGVEISLDLFNRLYENRVSRYPKEGNQLSPKIALNIKYSIATQLIDALLIKQKAMQKGIKISDSELDEALKKRKAIFKNPESYKHYLDSLPEGEQGFRETMRLGLLKEKLAGVDPEEPISDTEARVYYNRHLNRFHTPEHLIVQDIVFFIKKDGSAESNELQRKKVEAVHTKTEQPDTSFADLAIAHSEGPTVKIGGYLTRGIEAQMDPVLWRKLSGMKSGEISDVIRASDGYHILKLVQSNPETIKPFDTVKKVINDRIWRERVSTSIRQQLHTLRQQAKIKNHFTERNPLADEIPPSAGDVRNHSITFITLTPRPE